MASRQRANSKTRRVAMLPGASCHWPFCLLPCLLLFAGLLGACETPPSTASNDTAAEATVAGPTLRFNDAPDDDAYGTIDVGGLDAAALARLRQATLTRQDWTALLAVYAGDAVPEAPPAQPPMLGTYTVHAQGIRFAPSFPLVAGLAYTAYFDLALFTRTYGAAEAPPEREALTATFALPKPTTSPSTSVTHVYPTTDVLPMNQLKMYLHFSAPMRRGEAYDHIRLLDAETGEAIADPFVVIDQELWDAGRTRFTLLFDPGRIKRNLRPNLEEGLPLQEGKRYRLHIDTAWRDAAGQPLAQSYDKTFSVTAADRVSPDYKTWTLDAPQAATVAPVTLTFSEPLDHALLQRMLTVRTAQGHPLEGRIAIQEGEMQWSFTPARPWNAGTYVIEVDAHLEDLAGNNLRNVFDVDLNEQTPDRSAEHEPVRLPFNVAPL